MATGNITKRAVDLFGTAGATSFLWDQEVKGFGLKVTPSGARTYVYQYRVGGREAKVRRYTIGAHGHWTPDGARKEAKRLAQLVDQGFDPAATLKAQRRESVDLAFPAYAERFINEYLKIEWKGGHELAAGILRRDAIPVLKGKSLKEITRADITRLMDGMSGKPAARRNAFAVLRRMFKWSVNRGDLDVSPLRDMDPPAAPPSRDRVLTDQELAIIWRTSADLGYPFAQLVRLLILTGQRREEVAGLNWSELDRGKALWTLPAHRAKNGTVHDVPLSSAAVALLDVVASGSRQQNRATGWPAEGLVFSTTGRTRVSGFSAAKKRLDSLTLSLARNSAAAESASVAPWRLHDLRRTLATGLQRLGVRFEVTEAVLNHLSGSRSGVAAVYQRHDWSDEKRAALQAWAEHVAELVEK